jgi:hypothetical protein
MNKGITCQNSESGLFLIREMFKKNLIFISFFPLSGTLYVPKMHTHKVYKNVKRQLCDWLSYTVCVYPPPMNRCISFRFLSILVFYPLTSAF